MKYIDIAQKLDNSSALTQDQGDIIYAEIDSAFQNQDSITLDFSNVEQIITPFLNRAIGKLYEKYTSEQITALLEMKNFPKEKNKTLNLVISNAKRYYADRQSFESSVKDVIDNA